MALPEGFVIVPYEPRFREGFAKLTQAWIEQYFYLEPSDYEMLADPQAALDGQGELFLACRNGEVVGSCGFRVRADGVHELIKLGVAPEVRGRGIGSTLVRTVLEAVRQRGAERVELLSHSLLQPALELYRKAGFQSLPLRPEDRSEHEQVDTRMGLDFV